MTITKEDIRQYGKREEIRRIAKAIEFFTVCYNAVPAYPENERDKERYLDALLEQVQDMAKELSNV